jgi:hypothetical protein
MDHRVAGLLPVHLQGEIILASRFERSLAISADVRASVFRFSPDRLVKVSH